MTMFNNNEMDSYLRALNDQKPIISGLESELKRRKEIIKLMIKCFDNLYRRDIPEWLLSDIDAVCLLATTTVLSDEEEDV